MALNLTYTRIYVRFNSLKFDIVIDDSFIDDKVYFQTKDFKIYQNIKGTKIRIQRAMHYSISSTTVFIDWDFFESGVVSYERTQDSTITCNTDTAYEILDSYSGGKGLDYTIKRGNIKKKVIYGTILISSALLLIFALYSHFHQKVTWLP
jgi:hypothetical protein